MMQAHDVRVYGIRRGCALYYTCALRPAWLYDNKEV